MVGTQVPSTGYEGLKCHLLYSVLSGIGMLVANREPWALPTNIEDTQNLCTTKKEDVILHLKNVTNLNYKMQPIKGVLPP